MDFVYATLTAWYPLVVLGVGIAVVIGMILGLRMNAFLALIAAAIVVSLLSPGPADARLTRVADAFGSTAGNIGIVIALAAIIGKCLMDSGAADRIVRGFLRLTGEQRSPVALMGSAFVLSIPVFFDTVFYLLVPLARSLWRKTRKNFVLYALAIGAGGAVTHTMVPPTPGPLVMAETLGIDLGVMILAGTLIGLPTAAVGLAASWVVNWLMPLPMRPLPGEEDVAAPPPDDAHLPPFWLAIAPVLLPVLLISSDTIAKALAKQAAAIYLPLAGWVTPSWGDVTAVTSIVGDKNLALFLAAIIAMATLVLWRRLSFAALGKSVEEALMSGGLIILITAGGGAFGAMLRLSGLKELVEQSMEHQQLAGHWILLSAFAVASLMKFAQGSGTVAIITAASIFAGMNLSSATLGCHDVYLALAIASGSSIGDWMNNSGFWIFARMTGLTEVETLKSWTVVTAILGFAGMTFTLIAATLFPMV